MPIAVENVSYTYLPGTPFEHQALKNVSFTIEDGEFVGIIGHTGSGKSTLIQIISSLIPQTAGRVLIDGVDYSQKDADKKKLRRTVGVVFQYPEYQLFEETIAKDIAYGPRMTGIPEEELENRTQVAMELVGMDYETYKDKSPFELSGGEKRRAAIAGVMAMQPEVLILDEPTAGLDPKGRDLVLEQVAAYQKENGTTVLLVSHSMEDIARVAKTVLVMNGGQVAMYAPTPEVFSRAEELRAIGLAIPSVTRIFMGLREKGYPVGENVYTVEQAAARLLPLLKGGETHA